jgi:hypothetical protein
MAKRFSPCARAPLGPTPPGWSRQERMTGVVDAALPGGQSTAPPTQDAGTGVFNTLWGLGREGGRPSREAGVGGGGRIPTSDTSLQVELVEVEEGSDGFFCRGGWRARRGPPGPVFQDDAGEEDQEGQRSIISLHFLVGPQERGQL